MRKLTKNIALLFIFNILIVTTALAGGAPTPCSGDPDDPGYNPDGCPLDTYVWILAGLALVLGAVYLYRQQRVQSRA